MPTEAAYQCRRQGQLLPVVCDVWQELELTLLVWDNQAQNLGPLCWNMAPLLIRKEVAVENVYLRAEAGGASSSARTKRWDSVPSPGGQLVGCDGSPFREGRAFNELMAQPNFSCALRMGILGRHQQAPKLQPSSQC